MWNINSSRGIKGEGRKEKPMLKAGGSASNDNDGADQTEQRQQPQIMGVYGGRYLRHSVKVGLTRSEAACSFMALLGTGLPLIV